MSQGNNNWRCVRGAIALTHEIDLSTIDAFAFRLQELRRDPRRQAEVLKAYFHNKFEALEGNRQAIAETKLS